MSQFSLMRENMVKGQLLAEQVANSEVIRAFSSLPREKFVPHQLARIAYMEASFPLNKERFLLRPATLARLFQALAGTPDDKVLYIAGATGYGPALLNSMGVKVVALDNDEELTRKAEEKLMELHLPSIKVVLGPLEEGWPKEAPFDKIFIEGQVEKIPSSLVTQLKEGGEIVTIMATSAHGGEAVKFVKCEGVLTKITLFDAFGPRLAPFQRHKEFNF